jgi:isopenicillin N synthase-like dioxygenase
MAQHSHDGQDDSRGARRIPFSAIPVIDLAPLDGDPGAALNDVVAALQHACRNVGFFYVRNHGVPKATVEQAYQQARAFFALPDDIKMRVHCSRSPVIVRGYVPLGGTHADTAAHPDFHEAFELGLELPATDPDVIAGIKSYGPNQWPADMPGFRQTVYAYYQAMRLLGQRLFRLFALALDLEAGFFDEKIDKPTGHMRLLRYPPQADLDDRKSWGIAPHTDYECFTILAQDEVGGLQVQNADGQWIEAPPIPETFVINIGDLIARWTNDRFVSTPHRVIQRGARDRYSISHFYGANYNVMVDCFATCHDAGNPPKYKPVMAGEWALERDLAAYFGAGAPGITEASPRKR